VSDGKKTAAVATAGASIRDRLAARPKPGSIETVDVPGFGAVRVRRLSVADAIDVAKAEKPNQELLVRAIVDEGGSPVFDTLAGVLALDWTAEQALRYAANSVNTLDLSAARKN